MEVACKHQVHISTPRLTQPPNHPTSVIPAPTNPTNPQLAKAEDDEAAAASKMKDVEKKMAGANMIMKKRFAKQLDEEKRAFGVLQAATEELRAGQLRRQAELLGGGAT